MSIHRQNAKRDANEPEIIDALRQCGASVQPLSSKGVPDLLVGWRGRTHLLEVKMPGEKLNANQLDWHGNWTGSVPGVARSVEEAIQWLNSISER